MWFYSFLHPSSGSHQREQLRLKKQYWFWLASNGNFSQFRLGRKPGKSRRYVGIWIGWPHLCVLILTNFLKWGVEVKEGETLGEVDNLSHVCLSLVRGGEVWCRGRQAKACPQETAHIIKTVSRRGQLTLGPCLRLGYVPSGSSCRQRVCLENMFVFLRQRFMSALISVFIV